MRSYLENINNKRKENKRQKAAKEISWTQHGRGTSTKSICPRARARDYPTATWGPLIALESLTPPHTYARTGGREKSKERES